MEPIAGNLSGSTLEAISGISIPLVSVVVCVHNGEKYLAEALDSLLKQTYTSFEVLIINDGSTDSTQAIARSYCDDPRFRLVNSRENMGLALSRYKGLRLARGEWVGFLDSDDMWLPQKLDRQVSLINSDNSIVLVFSNGIEFDESGERGAFYASESKFPQGNLLLRLLNGNCLWASSVMVRKRDAFASGHFAHRLNYCDDYLLTNMVLSRGGKGVGVREPIVMYRKHAANMSTNKSEVYQQLETAHRRLACLSLPRACLRRARMAVRRDQSDQIMSRARCLADIGSAGVVGELVRAWSKYPKRLKPILIALTYILPGARSKALTRLRKHW